MQAKPAPRVFDAKPATRGAEPLLVGMVGPPGGGKTYSALRLAKGMQDERGGDIVLIDTENGRARKYSGDFQFLHVNFEPPHRPDHFLEAIRQQLPRKPACVITDSMSDEHEGEGGYLEWHDEMIPVMGGNEWAAWSKPKAARKRLMAGLLQIKVPLIFTFRAREKTQASREGGKTKITNLGWMPVAPLEIVHGLDLTCILPPKADGVPVWTSQKIGEDFIVKLPKFLAPYIQQGAVLDENTGRALARWAAGTKPPAVAGATSKPTTQVGDDGAASLATGAAPSPPAEDESARIARLDIKLADAAKLGMAELERVWLTIDKGDLAYLKTALDTRHKPTAWDADEAADPDNPTP